MTGAMNTVLLQQPGLHGDSSGILLIVKNETACGIKAGAYLDFFLVEAAAPGRPLPWLAGHMQGVSCCSGCTVCFQCQEQACVNSWDSNTCHPSISGLKKRKK